MIPRYTPKDFAALWSPETKFRTWLEVELAACEAMEKHGVVPKGTAAEVRPVMARLDPARIDEIELKTKHDVIAFLTHVEELAGAPARWLHRGMTSNDVLDTSFALLLVRATDAMLARLDGLLAALRVRVEEHRRTPLIGRSHGIHAEPTTFGVALAGHLAELARGRRRLAAAREEIAVGKIAGAVGTYAHLTLAIEADALAALGLVPETVATQVVARDRHAALHLAMSLVAAGIERLATNVRHWQRTEVAEAEERFTAGQKGSSAMPHKRNPITGEKLSGLARILRSNSMAALENVALWHERDISHSSVERVIMPDSTILLNYMLVTLAKLVDRLLVYPENMMRNLRLTKGLYFSQSVLLELTRRGLERKAAYEAVQRAAMKTWQGDVSLQENLAAEAEIANVLSVDEIEKLCSLDVHFQHVEDTFAKLGLQ